MVAKFDEEFQIIWKTAFQGLTNHDSFDVSPNEDYIYLASFTTTWDVIKINSTNGSINLTKSIDLINDCSSLTLSENATFTYVTGLQSTRSYIVMVNSTDLTEYETFRISI